MPLSVYESAAWQTVLDLYINRTDSIREQIKDMWVYDGGWNLCFVGARVLTFTVTPTDLAPLPVIRYDGSFTVSAVTGSVIWEYSENGGPYVSGGTLDTPPNTTFTITLTNASVFTFRLTPYTEAAGAGYAGEPAIV